MACADTTGLPAGLRLLVGDLPVAGVDDDQKWILRVLRDQGPALIRLLWRMLGSEQDALDAFQAAVCGLLARGREAMGPNVGGYFYRAAANQGIQLLRQRRRHHDKHQAIAEVQSRRQAEQDGPLPAADQVELLEQMRAAIAGLPVHLRDVILLREMAELPYAQVGAILGITPGTARLYRRLAVVRLMGLIGEESNDDSAHPGA